MANFIFDLDNRNKGYIQSDFLNNIREHFSVEDIAGKVIRLTAGCELRCPKVNQVCIPTTTSTTTISCAITGGTITCVIPT